MPLNSVQIFCRNIIDGMAIPGSPVALKAQITPPVLQNVSSPMAFVWGGNMSGKRTAGPRGKPGHAGFKELAWDVDVWLILLTNPNNAMVDQQFPLVVDAVMDAFWSTTMPTVTTDPTTGLETQIRSIGEQFGLEYSPVHTPQTQRMLYYAARLRLSVFEAVNA